jgi:Flp pilus assembly protein TadB
MLEANWYKQSFRNTNCQVLFNQTSLTTTNQTIIKYRVQFFNNDGQQTTTWTHEFPKTLHQLSNGQVVPCYYFIYETTQPTLLDEPGSNYIVCLVFILIAATVDSLVVVGIGILLLIMAIRMFLSNLPI